MHARGVLQNNIVKLPEGESLSHVVTDQQGCTRQGQGTSRGIRIDIVHQRNISLLSK